MHVDLSAIKLAPASASPSALRHWALGQLLDATVIGRDSNDAIRLRVSGTTVSAATKLPLQAGQNLKLKVTQLKPIVTLSVDNPAPAVEKNLVRAAINRTLPIQRPIDPLLTELDFVRKSLNSKIRHSAPSSGIPPAVAQAAQKILQTIPTWQELRDANRLPELLRRAGIFSEAGTKHAISNKQSPFPENDLKWQLLRLRGTIRESGQAAPLKSSTREQVSRPSPHPAKSQLPAIIPTVSPAAKNQSEALSPVDSPPLRKLSQLVDGVIAKIETNQLKAVSALLNGESQLVLDLPIAFEDGPRVVQFKIAQEQHNQTDDQPTTTTVVLQVPIDASATLQAVVSIVADTVSIRLWSNDDQIRESIASRRGSLVDRMQGNGIEKVTVTVGEITPIDDWGSGFDQLVDDTA